MSKPQSPELRRSGRVPALDPDASEAVLSAEQLPGTGGNPGPVPPEQQPGHRPDEDPDRPEKKIAEALGITSDTETDPKAIDPEATDDPSRHDDAEQHAASGADDQRSDSRDEVPEAWRRRVDAVVVVSRRVVSTGLRRLSVTAWTVARFVDREGTEADELPRGRTRTIDV